MESGFVILLHLWSTHLPKTFTEDSCGRWFWWNQYRNTSLFTCSGCSSVLAPKDSIALFQIDCATEGPADAAPLCYFYLSHLSAAAEKQHLNERAE
jgi:hypothetical protein